MIDQTNATDGGLPADNDSESSAPADFNCALNRLEFPEHKALALTDSPEFDGAEFGHWILKRQGSHVRSAKEMFNLYISDFGCLSRPAVNRLFFAEKVVHGWLDQLMVDDEIKKALQLWSTGLTAILASDRTIATNYHHPVRELLDIVEQHSLGWFSGLERNGKAWLEHLGQISNLLTGATALGSMAHYRQLETTQQFIEKDNARVKILEKRVRESEGGADRAWYYRQLVQHTIVSNYTATSMPAVVTQFISGPWRDSMQLVLLEEGTQGNDWPRQVKLLETLVWAMQDNDDAQAKQRLYQIAARLVDEVAKGLRVFKNSPHEADPWLDRLQELVMLRVKGQPIEAAPASFDAVEPGFRVKEDLLTDQGYGLIDKWFLHQSSGTRQKCVAYLPYKEEVVWVNYLGRKLGTQAWTSVQQELKQQILRPFTASSSLDLILSNTVSRFLSIDTLQQKQRQFAHEREAARGRMVDAARDQAREKAMAEAVRIQKDRDAAAKRLEEERRHAEEQARQEELQAEENAHSAKLQSTREAVDRIKLGGWLELIDGAERKRCKLAVRLNATDKLVFVDRLGLKIGDFKREEIVSRLMAGTAKILDEGCDFDQRLSRVVGSIRSDKR